MDGMKKSTVVLRRCETYEKADVGAAVSDCIDALGGADALFPDKGARILIKPNLLTRAAPEKAVTTHPSVFGAVCRYLPEFAPNHSRIARKEIFDNTQTVFR